MAQEFLYICSSCEKSFPVTVKMAGAATVCPICNAAIELPGMREIRQLEPVVGDEPPTSARSRNETRSWLFSGGLLVFVIAGLSAFALTQYANELVTESVLDKKIAFGKTQINKMQAGHLWDAWDSMTGEGLPDWEETVQVRYNKQAGYLSNIATGLYALSGIGAIALASSFFISKK